MAKIKVMGNALVLTSDLKTEVIKDVKNYNEKACTLFNENKEPVFALETGDHPSCSNYGVCMDSTNSEGKAYITIVGLDRKSETKDSIIKRFAPVLVKLNAVEKQIEDIKDQVDEQIEHITESIEILD